MAIVQHVQISINPVSKLVTVTSPYNADFTDGAKMIGGRWQSLTRNWSFPAGTEEKVRALCVSVYGVADGAPQLSRGELEAQLAKHLRIVCDLQDKLDALDKAEGKV